MPLKTNILAAEINNLSDARYFAAFPVNWMSFVCNPVSANYLPEEKIEEIMNWVSGPKMTLDLRGCRSDRIEECVEKLRPESILIDYSQAISSEMKEHLYVFRVVYVAQSNLSSLIDQLADADPSDAIIFDLQTNQVPAKLLFSNEFQHFLTKHTAFIQANVSPSDIANLLDLPIKGLVVLSGNEEKVGIRSFEDVQDIMDELEYWT